MFNMLACLTLVSLLFSAISIPIGLFTFNKSIILIIANRWCLTHSTKDVYQDSHHVHYYYQCLHIITPRAAKRKNCSLFDKSTKLGTTFAYFIPVAEEVVDMRGGSAGLTQTYFYNLVR